MAVQKAPATPVGPCCTCTSAPPLLSSKTMFQRAAQCLLLGGRLSARQISSSVSLLESDVSTSAAFARKVGEVTNTDPSFPSQFLGNPKVQPSEGPTPSKIKLTFSLPHRILMQSAEVDMALVPAVSGDFGVMPGHVPTVAELRPGIIAVHKELDKVVDKYFVSGGFAVAHADSTVEITAVEAASLDELDPAAVKAGLAEYTARLASAAGKDDDLEAAISQVGIEVYSAMDAALQ